MLKKIDAQQLLYDIRTTLGSECDSAKKVVPGSGLKNLDRWHFRPIMEPPGDVEDLTFDFFLPLQEVDFVESVFLYLLKRRADSSGRAHYLSLLSSGVSKEEVVLRIRLSREGRYHHVKIKGWGRAVFLCVMWRIPWVGKLVATLHRVYENTSMIKAASKRLRHLENQLTELDQKLLLYRERINLLSKMLEKQSNYELSLDDSLYLAFEDRFRGTRADVKGKVSYYLPYVLKNEEISELVPLLDIGCGRGEWLELLKENRVPAYGIDKNRCFVDVCAGAGLDVRESDLFEFLNNMTGNSAGAVTVFQVVEHLSFSRLIYLFAEIKRVLVPGGMMILETPNPKNILVSGHSFYTDPTHLKPLTPMSLRFFVEQAGFKNIEMHELNQMINTKRM